MLTAWTLYFIPFILDKTLKSVPAFFTNEFPSFPEFFKVFEIIKRDFIDLFPRDRPAFRKIIRHFNTWGSPRSTTSFRYVVRNPRNTNDIQTHYIQLSSLVYRIYFKHIIISYS